ncbi:MAG TPA: choice-of-anchor B family protein [Saprospiraceae bacterium]|nr:choice-of-anchor B family protein [Saprospiraceae bacterium]
MMNKESLHFKGALKYVLVVFYALIHITNMFGQTEATLISNWSDPENIPPGGGDRRYNDCWGFEQGGTEYGVIGSTLGTHIIDLDGADGLTEVAFIPGKFSSNRVVHRDHHEFNGYLYAVCDQGTSSLQVIDVSQLPGNAPVVHEDSVNIMRAHNVFIDTATLKMYTCGVRLPDFGRVPLQVWSIEDPEKPELLNSIFEIEGVDISYVHDLYARNDTVFLNAGNQGLVIADMADVENPELFGVMANYPDAGYNHSGWWNERGDRYYLADETHGRDIKIVDVSDIGNPRVIQLIEAESDPEGSIVHNLIVKNDMLYVSYYFDGLQVFDVSGDTSTCWAYNYPTSDIEPVRGGFGGAWGVYPLLPSGRVIVSDMQNGMFLFEIPQLQPSDTSDVDGTPPCQPVLPSANVQIIHNSPDPAVDIWVGGNKAIENLQFRDATGFLELNSGMDLEIGVAPHPSDDISDVIYTQTLNLQEDQNYIALAQGAIGNASRPFEIQIIENASRGSGDQGTMRFSFAHGSIDADDLRIESRDLINIVADNLSYGQVSDYIDFSVQPFLIDIFEEGAETPTGTYQVIPTGLFGAAGVVFASGYLDESLGAPFALFLALADGTVIELPSVEFANWQIIHNSPGTPVDVYVNDQLAIDDFEYTSATNLTQIVAGVELRIDVAAANSSSSADAIFSESVTLENYKNYLVFAEGIVGDMDAPFGLSISDNVKLETDNPDQVEFLIHHGSPDAPSIDLGERSGNLLLTDLSFGETSETYLALDPRNYFLSLYPTGTQDEFKTYLAGLNGFDGLLGVVYATGLVGNNGPEDEFRLLLVLPDGQTFELPEVIFSNVQLLHNSPDPSVDVFVTGTKVIEGLEFRQGTLPIELASTSGDIELAISPEGGSISDAFYSTNLSLEKDQNYLLIAEGILGDPQTPFNIQVVEDYRLESTNESSVDILVVHGSPDAPEVDILANGNSFVEDIAFGETTDYLTVAPANYELSVTPSQDNSNIVARYLAELEEAAGSSVAVFASGLLTETPEFGLWALLTDGTTFPLPLISSNVERIEDIIDLRVGPNPASDFGMIHFSQAMDVNRIDLMTIQGQVVRNYQNGQLEGYSGTYRFDLHGVPGGAYVLRVITDDKTFVSKLSVVR